LSQKIKKEEKVKREPIKKVPLMMGVLFMVLGIIFLALVFVSPDSTIKSTYAIIVVALLGFGVNYLDKSGILER
jgi:UDP-N-acetylmuramyl pentapeptide phosphotransferase/UDP-N-acetylglucosamine-1-phosphate transferase